MIPRSNAHIVAPLHPHYPVLALPAGTGVLHKFEVTGHCGRECRVLVTWYLQSGCTETNAVHLFLHDGFELLVLGDSRDHLRRHLLPCAVLFGSVFVLFAAPLFDTPHWSGIHYCSLAELPLGAKSSCFSRAGVKVRLTTGLENVLQSTIS